MFHASLFKGQTRKMKWLQQIKKKKHPKKPKSGTKSGVVRKHLRKDVAMPAAIIVCCCAPPDITDRPSLPWWFFLIQGGTLLCPSRSHYTGPGAQMWLQIERVQTSAQKPRGPARHRPHPAVSALWKNIFQCLICYLPIHLPHVALIFMRF